MTAGEPGRTSGLLGVVERRQEDGTQSRAEASARWHPTSSRTILSSFFGLAMHRTNLDVFSGEHHASDDGIATEDFSKFDRAAGLNPNATHVDILKPTARLGESLAVAELGQFGQ
jgi:hypothetical protein